MVSSVKSEHRLLDKSSKEYKDSHIDAGQYAIDIANSEEMVDERDGASASRKKPEKNIVRNIVNSASSTIKSELFGLESKLSKVKLATAEAMKSGDLGDKKKAKIKAAVSDAVVSTAVYAKMFAREPKRIATSYGYHLLQNLVLSVISFVNGFLFIIRGFFPFFLKDDASLIANEIGKIIESDGDVVSAKKFNKQFSAESESMKQTYKDVSKTVKTVSKTVGKTVGKKSADAVSKAKKAAKKINKSVGSVGASIASHVESVSGGKKSSHSNKASKKSDVSNDVLSAVKKSIGRSVRL